MTNPYNFVEDRTVRMGVIATYDEFFVLENDDLSELASQEWFTMDLEIVENLNSLEELQLFVINKTVGALEGPTDSLVKLSYCYSLPEVCAAMGFDETDDRNNKFYFHPSRRDRFEDEIARKLGISGAL